MSELKPCPFCGGTKIRTIEGRAYCVDCGLNVAFALIGKWNTRPIEDKLQAEIDRLKSERRWIPVSERLPEEYGIYEICSETNSTGLLFFDSDGWVSHSMLGLNPNKRLVQIMVNEVKYWRALPPPPEGDK